MKQEQFMYLPLLSILLCAVKNNLHTTSSVLSRSTQWKCIKTGLVLIKRTKNKRSDVEWAGPDDNRIRKEKGRDCCSGHESTREAGVVVSMQLSP